MEWTDLDGGYKSTNAIIDEFHGDALFEEVSTHETAGIIQRDNEDNEKLEKGIQLAVSKGVLPAHVDVEPVRKVDVLGRTADDVADDIIAAIGDAEGGKVIVLQGLSGTGKGTAVATLQRKLNNAVTWSNGNVFRALTFLAQLACEAQGVAFSEECLTPDLLQQLVAMLEFGQFNGRFDTKIEGFGRNVLVSEIENTDLRSAMVSRAIPTVANYTQGEVVKFANDAVALMSRSGLNVLVEGREATLNFIRSPYRFELILSDTNLIGRRRLAQKLLGAAITTHAQNEEVKVKEALQTALVQVAQTFGLGQK
eukprot:c45728_g1_i1.p1 GENE.c45728_g1_i1~~c45728_g1_i1.p1  ORF type:complete len:328 (-),score=92.32 c45728_g1_i1:59-988(-)